MKDQETIGLELLEKFNLDIADVEDFDPHSSKITMTVRPDADFKSWGPVTKATKVNVSDSNTFLHLSVSRMNFIFCIGWLLRNITWEMSVSPRYFCRLFCTWNFIFQNCTLPRAIYILDGHLCRSHTLTRDAATFDLKTTSVKSTFHGVLDVTLDAAKAKKICCIFRRYQSMGEMVALQIPKMLVSK